MRNAKKATCPSLFEDLEEESRRLTPLDSFDGVPAYLLDIPETIPQMGYASHQFFRYYGKFPSIVGREIIRRFAPRGTRVADCYAGSGTTLVEAQIAGCPSYGIDINPLAVIACRVKTRYYDHAALRAAFEATYNNACHRSSGWSPSTVSGKKLTKWFGADAIRDLGRIRAAIDDLPSCPERDFLVVAFLGIIRRCSNAFDGEVRPHVNRSKKPRPAFDAFQDKFADMLRGLIELDGMRPAGVSAEAVVGDNRDPSSFALFGPDPVDLVVAHPPYLNSFNYLQVYSLEFMWAEALPEVWNGWTPQQVRTLEHRAWPATDSELTAKYYEDFWAAMKASSAVMGQRAVLAVVVGDATIRKKLEPVHSVMWNHLKDSGFEPLEIWFRTTHYGIGKYAYSDRADYHGDAPKRDAVMFFAC